MNYRKKPVVIKAFQMTLDAANKTSEWPEWLLIAYHSPVGSVGSMWVDNVPSGISDEMYLGTLEGNMRVNWDDYIIRGVKGELYPCKPDIFHLTYEKVTDDEEGFGK